MSRAYQYDASGYFAGEIEDYGLLPNNTTYTAPTEQDGHIPRWNGEAWEQVENHQGKEGYVDGQPFTVKDYGPLPEGWSDSPPPPTPEERAARARAERDSRISATDYLMMPDYPVSDGARAALGVYRQALRDVPLQAGFPDEIAWPDLPEVLE